MVRKRNLKKSPIFAENVKKLMDDAKMSQIQFGEANGVSQSTVAKWLDGTVPNWGNLSDLAQANGVNESWFFEIHPKIPIDNISQRAKLSPMEAQLPGLLERIKKATQERGKKSELATFLGVNPVTVSKWLSGVIEPGGETTLKLLLWVEQQERH